MAAQLVRSLRTPIGLSLRPKRAQLLLLLSPPAALCANSSFRGNEAESRCEEPMSTALQTTYVSGLDLLRRMLLLGIWLVPISIMICLGLVSKDSKSEAAPVLFARCLEQCGPTFVKLGQWLATRRDFFSESTCRELGRLQESVRSSFQAEEEELRGRCSEQGLPVKKIDCSEPIGAGCVSQVYSGELDDGQQVAIKLRRPHIRKQVALDVILLRYFGVLAERANAELKWLSFQEGINEFSRHLEKQLDFRVEAHNLRRFGRNFASHRYVKVPEVHLADEDVLVMSYVRGTSLSDLLADGSGPVLSKHVQEQLWSVLGRMVSKMVFADKFVHQDLHPGNLRVVFESQRAPGSCNRPSWVPEAIHSIFEPLQYWLPLGPAPMSVYLLDAGLAASLNEHKLSYMAEVVKHGIAGKAEAAGKVFLEIHEKQGLAKYAEYKDRFVQALGKLASAALIMQPDPENLQHLGFSSEEEYRDSRLGDYFGRMAQLFAHHKIRMDHEIWSLLTSFALIESSMHQLDGNRNVLRCTLPYIFGSFSALNLLQGFQALRNSEQSLSRHKVQVE